MVIFYPSTKLGILFVISGQTTLFFNQFVNFPNFVKNVIASCIVTKYFCLRFSTECKDIFKNIFTRKHIFDNFNFLKLVTNKVRIRRVHIGLLVYLLKLLFKV